jgi:prepilin signal peptidase PulO-like enzyme (type II secretory pathway)
MMFASILARFFSLKMAVFMFFLAALCIATFNVIGSSLDNQGILHEPFFLIPIAWLCVFIGLFALLGAIIASVMERINKKSSENKDK